MSIRDLFRETVYGPETPEVLEEGKGRNKTKKRKAKKAAKNNKDKMATPTSANKATGVQSGTNPIGKYGLTKIASAKDKDRDPKQRRKQKIDMDESAALSEEELADSLLEELVTDFDEAASFEFNEATIAMLKEAFMNGFLSSCSENNGSNCKAVYKNSALKPDAEVWNNNLKERFNRFVYNEKKKREA